MKKGIVPCSAGIDTDSTWYSYSHIKGWIFGYILHMISSNGSSVIIPLSADFTTANIFYNQLFKILTSSLASSTTIKEISYMTADPGYDNDDNYNELYELSMDLGFQLVCPVRRYRNTPSDRLELVDLYESILGQTIYSNRRTSIELLIEHIKSIFRIDHLPIKGYDKAYAIVLLSVLLYQIVV